MNILGSASKLVFILMAVSVIVLTFMRIIDAKDFFSLVMMVFAYYFGKNQSTTGQTIE
jgi:hypothetical protein